MSPSDAQLPPDQQTTSALVEQLATIAATLAALQSSETMVAREMVEIIPTTVHLARLLLNYNQVNVARRREAEEATSRLAAIEEATSRLAAIVESSNDAIVSTTLAGFITSWNRGAERLYGYPAAEVVGQSIAMIVRADHPQEWHEITQRLKQGEHIEDFETVHASKAGRRIDVLLTVSPITSAEGEIIGAATIARDISRRKRAEERLRAANEALSAALQVKQELLQNVSHELRTPLTHIRGYAELLAQGLLGDLTPEQTEAATIIVDKTAHLSHLVDDLLALRTLESEREQLHDQSVDLMTLVTQAVADMRASCPQVNLSEQRASSMTTAEVDGNPDRLRQVLDNLLTNACKFTPEGGWIRVSLAAQGDYFHLSVADSGPGVPPEALERIFQRFYQVDASSTRRAGGLGLGLAITREIVENHGGRIWCESTLGKGATFHVLLPRQIGESPITPSMSPSSEFA